jgi:hypothetical protein
MDRADKRDREIARALTGFRSRLPGMDPSGVWLLIGDTLSELEAILPQSPDGRPWTELVRDLYEGLGYGGLSVGHVQKVRRIRNFVRRELGEESALFPDGALIRAQVSALEVAERFHALDPYRGRAALISCVRDGRKFAELKREYDAYLTRNPDRLPRKQATWLRKRTSPDNSEEGGLIERVLLSDPETFLGASAAILRPFRPADLSPFLKETRFGFRLTKNGEERTLGVGLVTKDLVGSRGTGDLLARLEFQSGFFDSYWSFVTADREAADKLCSGLEEIGIDRVGVLRLTRDDWDLIRHPSSAPTNPDRRRVLRPDPDQDPEPA